METDPKIDYEKFATLAGLKNAATARETLRQAKKKLLDMASAAGGNSDAVGGSTAAGSVSTPTGSGKAKVKATGESAKKRKTPAKAKKGDEVQDGDGEGADAGDAGDDEDGNGEEETPTKNTNSKLKTPTQAKKTLRAKKIKTEILEDDEDAADFMDAAMARNVVENSAETRGLKVTADGSVLLVPRSMGMGSTSEDVGGGAGEDGAEDAEDGAEGKKGDGNDQVLIAEEDHEKLNQEWTNM